MKTTILLAIALFLAAAPEPDSDAISEMTAGFIKPNRPAQLQAAEGTPDDAVGRANTSLEPAADNSISAIEDDQSQAL